MTSRVQASMPVLKKRGWEILFNIYTVHIVPVARLEAYGALKFSRLESFRALNVLFVVGIIIFKKKII